MEPWLITAIAVAVLLVIIATIYLLRRRRAGTVLIVKPDGRVSKRRS